MFKHAATSVAIALLFTASLNPVIHGFSTHPSRSSVAMAVSGGDPEPTEPGVSGGDPEPTEPGVVQTVLAMLGLA